MVTAFHMKQSLTIPNLAAYTARQMNTFFPDGNEVSAEKLADLLLPGVLVRLERCFGGVVNLFKSGGIFFNHLNSDHYSMFLYLLSNEAFRTGPHGADVAVKGYLLNKALHGLEAFYEIELPEVFWFAHAVGSVLGRAKYGNGLLVAQGCTVGNKNGRYPVLGEKVVLCANSTILGDCILGSRVCVGAGSQLIDETIPDGSTVVGRSPQARILPQQSPLVNFYFAETLPHA